jgi:hypothetical protein
VCGVRNAPTFTQELHDGYQPLIDDNLLADKGQSEASILLGRHRSAVALQLRDQRAEGRERFLRHAQPKQKVLEKRVLVPRFFRQQLSLLLALVAIDNYMV